jgi:putative FmdB family regulatory protein
MPTYEYECDSCGITFERLQRISDAPIRQCPECGGEVRRLISTGGGLVFKGPGFYATDYASGRGGSSGSDSTDSGSGGGTEKGADRGANKAKSEVKGESSGGGGNDNG